jgi:hypothetical protein
MGVGGCCLHVVGFFGRDDLGGERVSGRGPHRLLTLLVASRGYLTVVRFLAYLDLRIRREGWEAELMMRAEGPGSAGS